MKYKNIYVVAPYRFATGGVELAHQLVSYLRDKNQNAFIVYLDNGKIVENAEITLEYAGYNIKTSSVIEESEYNILVLPETYLYLVKKYSKIKIACWWMSVDFYYIRCSFKEQLFFTKGIISKLKLVGNFILKRIDSYDVSLSYLKENNQRLLHLYQSHYAQHHLYNNGFSNVLPLSDYINTTFTQSSNTNRKENIILYNPKKGFKFTKKLIERMPDFTFIPLENLNRNELVDLMGRAKLYIDFGNFPGKDRLHREALMNGCCIITGKLGASFFYEDVPIDYKYKFDNKESDISQIKDRIIEIFDNYDNLKNDFSFIREIIKKEKEVFYSEIDCIFGIH